MRNIFIFTLLCLGLQSQAQIVFKNLEEVLAFADAHNSDLVNASDKTLLAKNELTSAKGALLPQINANAGFQDNIILSTTLIPAEMFGGPAGTYQEVQFGQKYNYTANLTGSIDLVNLGNWFQIQSKKAGLLLANASETEYKLALHEQLTSVYYITLLSGEAYRLSVLNKQVSDSLLQSITDKYTQGLIDAITLNNVKINNRIVHDNMNSNQLASIQNMNSLKVLMGISISDSVLLAEHFSISFSVPYDPKITDLGVSPSVKASEYQLLQSKATVNASMASFAPRLSFISSLGYQQFNQEFALSFASSSWKPVQYIGLRLEIPVFSGLSRSTNVKMAKIQASIAERNLQSAKMKTDAENQNLFEEYHINKNKVENAIEIYDLYSTNHKLFQQRFEEGIINIDQYLQSFTDFLNGQSRYLNALSDYYISKAKIQNRINIK